MFIDFFKRNSILIFFFSLSLVAIALILVEIDKQYYQSYKLNIIQDAIIAGEFNGIADLEGNPTQEITDLALKYLQTRDPRLEIDLRAKMQQLVRGRGIIWRINIKPRELRQNPQYPLAADAREEAPLEIEYAYRDKLKEINTFANSLFLRNFEGRAFMPIGASGRNKYYLQVYYTSPRNDPKIRELTIQYRWISAFILAILSILLTVFARGLLFPMHNVITALDSSTPERTSFVHRPHSRLEALFDRMALDAVIARLQGHLRDAIARHPQMTGWEVVSLVCRAFGEQVGVPLVAGLEMVAEGPGRIRATGQRVISRHGDWPQSEEEMAALIDGLVPSDGRTRLRLTLTDFDPPRECALEITQDPERSGIRYLFAVALDAGTHEAAYVSLPHLLGRLTELVEAGLQTLSLRNQLLVQERGRANISLSRNLGHDLTNIIATSKLELIALERLLGAGQLPEDSRRRQILGESLHGLLRSVRFMQETVNLYRAYAFLQHPILETHDGNALVSETLDLFAMSISAKVNLERELTPDAPRCVVDPRLIKLALFNLFANALEAIRKTGLEQQMRGWTRVSTRRAKEGGLCIAVEDSGTGIMNGAGRRAQPHEIEKIFELGYTSRRTEGAQGEGLGLNWVRTIVQDLHGGSIFAENSAKGGARFVLTFPPLETAPSE